MKPTPGQYERYRNIFKTERLPLTFVDLEPFDRNIRYIAGTQKDTGKTIRVHTKSIRCVSLTKRILDKGGSAYQGVMTYSMEETAHLASQGLDDFIVAYPTAQPSDLELFIEMTKQGTKVSLMVDSMEHLKLLSKAGQKAGVTLSTCLDVDMSYRPLKSNLHLGVRRSPVRTVEDALGVANASLGMKGVSIHAVMGYEAHIAGLNDNVPGQSFKNAAMAALKKVSIFEFHKRRVNIVKLLQKEGVPIRTVNGGGSGSLVSTGKDPSVTEVTAGSGFFASGLFWHYKEVDFTPSAFFAVQVVRKPTADMVTCHGGGYIASGASGKDKLPVPVYPEKLQLLPLEGAGEVQTPLLLPKHCETVNLGDPIFFQHAKAGELTERFNEILLVQGDKIVDRVKTYRGEGKAFL